MRVKESGEDYLETILILKKKKGSVRSVDIVEELGFSKSSVSRAVNILKERGLIDIDKKGFITFTKEGLDYSNAVYERHMILQIYLTSIGVDEKTAEQDACRIEHVISKKTYEAIKNLVKNS